MVPAATSFLHDLDQVGGLAGFQSLAHVGEALVHRPRDLAIALDEAACSALLGRLVVP
jgi:hypothetical protein